MIQIIPLADPGPEWPVKIVNDFFIFDFSQLVLYCIWGNGVIRFFFIFSPREAKQRGKRGKREDKIR